jgi:Zn-finger protein
VYDYLSTLYFISEFIDDFEKNAADPIYYNMQKGKLMEPYWFYCFCPKYMKYWQPLNDIISISDIFGIEVLETNKRLLIHYIEFLANPQIVESLQEFKSNLNAIRKTYKIAENEIKEKINLLDKEELRRLNEAINCFICGLNYSTVTMSVSAIENRLFCLMYSKCKEDKLEELTLGQLIREYLDNKIKYSSIVPKKHEPLLEYSNTYRIFSVHPKKERITRPIATSIFYMTCSFLFDKDMKITAEERKT